MNTKTYAILGFGAEGKSVLDWLLNSGVSPANITILDENETADIPAGIPNVTGKHAFARLDRFDILYKSPGISPYRDDLLPYKHKFSSATHIFFSHYQGKVIGISATKGKSTTASLLYACLTQAGLRVAITGNVGSVPALSLLRQSYDYVIYEFSSYMLEDFIPPLYIAVLGNIYQDHTPWHRTQNNYVTAKLNLLQNTQYALVGKQIADV